MPTYIVVDGVSHYCTITEISPDGARIRLMKEEDFKAGSELSIDVEDYATIRAEILQNARGILRLKFLHGDEAAADLAQWLVAAKPQRRQKRHECQIAASVVIASAEAPCTVADISRTGASISLGDVGNLAVSSEIILRIPGYGSIAASVRHISGNSVGLMLIDGYQGELPPAASLSGGDS